MRKTLLLFCFLHAMFFVRGQEENMFLPLKENVHLHLNKTNFLKGERLWFKAYIQDQNTKLPSLETTNLHVGIYAEDGTEVKRKLFYVENGLAQGDFSIDSTLTQKKYIVLAWTNYMRNFKDLQPFRQDVEVLKTDLAQELGEVLMQLYVYPEGGHLIAGAYNNLGILVDNGLGQGVKLNDLELVDSSGNVIKSNITTNNFGMGKIGMVVSANESYYLQRQLPDGSYVKTMLPKAMEGDLGLTIDNNAKEKVLLTVLASENTFKEKESDIYTIALYQDDFIRFEDMPVNEQKPALSFEREELPFGIITVVLFNEELKPLSYRMFFNYKEQDRRIQALEIEHCLTEFGDSLQIDLILPKDTENTMNLSLSVLPEKSIAYHPDNSVVSSFLLRPYIKQYYQDHYFFQEQNRKKRFELDNRLIIEGWGKYDWDSRKQQKMELAYAMETGIAFEGRVLDADLTEENQISLIAELSGAIDFETLDAKKSFSGNMKLFEKDSLRLSLLTKKGKLRKPRANLEFVGNVSYQSLDEMMNLKTIRAQMNYDEESMTERSLNINEGIINLEEVVVTEKRPVKNTFQISAQVQGRLIDDSEIQKTPALSTYLKKLGFIPRGINGEIGFYVIRPPGFARVPISINGMGATSAELIGMPLSSVKFLAFNKSRDQPFISIILNPDYVPPNQRNKFLKFAIKNGYARPQNYFEPNYPSYTSSGFRNYGALDWKSNISVGTELPATVTIPVHGQDQVILYVEGMATKGQLLSVSRKLNLEE